MTSGASHALPFDPARKTFTLDGARAWRAGVRGRVVFTNGVFDLLHPGHVDVLLDQRANHRLVLAPGRVDEADIDGCR